MTDSELGELLRTIEELNESTGVLTERTAEQTQLQTALREDLAKIEKKLPEFVPRRRFRLAIGGVVVALLLALALGLYFRAEDSQEDRRKANALAQEQDKDRQNSLRGCERANDVRATLREIIELAVAVRPPPADLPPELAELYRQGQANTLALRAKLLALPGVQPIDCEAQYPKTPARSEA